MHRLARASPCKACNLTCDCERERAGCCTLYLLALLACLLERNGGVRASLTCSTQASKREKREGRGTNTVGSRGVAAECPT